MELFERIRFLSQKTGCSLAKMALHIGVTPQAFNKWLNIKSQRNIWEHLPKLLELFPNVRVEWLFIGREPAFHDGTKAEAGPTHEDMKALEIELAKTRAELEEERALNRKLTTRLLIEGASDQAAVTNTGKVGEGHE